MKVVNFNELMFLSKALPKATYRFAKTMPESPHWYTLIDTWDNPKDFYRAVVLLNKYGKPTWYKYHKYICFYWKEYKYWTMDKNLKNVTLINRALIE